MRLLWRSRTSLCTHVRRDDVKCFVQQKGKLKFPMSEKYTVQFLWKFYAAKIFLKLFYVGLLLLCVVVQKQQWKNAFTTFPRSRSTFVNIKKKSWMLLSPHIHHHHRAAAIYRIFESYWILEDLRRHPPSDCPTRPCVVVVEEHFHHFFVVARVREREWKASQEEKKMRWGIRQQIMQATVREEKYSNQRRKKIN